MKLIGGFGSPFVRRVAVSLNFLGFDWDQEAISAFDNPDPVRKHNPLVRVPTLVASLEGPGEYRFDIRLQGERETVFFDI